MRRKGIKKQKTGYHDICYVGISLIFLDHHIPLNLQFQFVQPILLNSDESMPASLNHS